MTYKELQAEMISAMKNKDKEKKAIIAGIITEAKNLASNQAERDNLPEELVNQAILKEKNAMVKAIEETKKKPDIDFTAALEEYNKRIAILNEFAPKMISDKQELRSEIHKILTKNDIVVVKENKGVALRTVMQTLKGSADLRVAKELVEEIFR